MEPDDLVRAVLSGLADGRRSEGREGDRRRVAGEDGMRRQVRCEAAKDGLLDRERFADCLRGRTSGAKAGVMSPSYQSSRD